MARVVLRAGRRRVPAARLRYLRSQSTKLQRGRFFLGTLSPRAPTFPGKQARMGREREMELSARPLSCQGLNGFACLGVGAGEMMEARQKEPSHTLNRHART